MANESSLIFEAITNDDFAAFVQLLGKNEKEMAENAMKITRLLKNNPREVTYADAVDIYNAAY